MTRERRLKVLILAGGLSSRMGSPKHMLPFIDGRPVYQHLFTQTQHACPDAEGYYLSLRGNQQATEDDALQFLLDDPKTAADIGPAAGLLAAYRADDACNWLILACDYSLLSELDIRDLVDKYEAPITCFENADGWAEPLLGIWSPAALKRLHENVQRGITGPKSVIKDLTAKLVKPQYEASLFNTNKPDEWDAAMDMARRLFLNYPS